MLAGRLFKQIVRSGTLRVTDASGTLHVYGDGKPPVAAVRLHDRALHRRLFLQPSLAAGEAYTDGTLTVDGGSIFDFLDLMGRNLEQIGRSGAHGPFETLAPLLRRLHQFNPIRRARDNVRHHYDLSGALYELFLDGDRQYSCAYFRRPTDDLETAQRQKCAHIAAKLMLEPGQRVLDIGCGWGGLSLYLASRFDADVTGITLSEEQLQVARSRASRAGLAERVRFELCDYREVNETFDRIVSVGMFEHVGVGHYRRYFQSLYDHLSESGVALVHTIGHADRPSATNPWIRRYIFPGGYTPALSEVMAAIESTVLWPTDIEVWRLHYAETLRHWRRRFLANRPRALTLYDERFCRMWEFYLAGCEVAFRYLRQCVFQIQLAKHQDALPLTRDYMFAAERGLAADESARSDAA